MAATWRDRASTLRRPAGTVRVAIGLWVVWAVVVWNVVFDRVIVLAGRQYISAASAAAQAGGSYARMDDWMRPAVVNGAWIASAASAAILLVGLCALRFARERNVQMQPRRHEDTKY